jgi:hypothetical protein
MSIDRWIDLKDNENPTHTSSFNAKLTPIIENEFVICDPFAYKVVLQAREHFARFQGLCLVGRECSIPRQGPRNYIVVPQVYTLAHFLLLQGFTNISQVVVLVVAKGKEIGHMIL